MVRTLADGGSKKAVASKAPRKQLGGGSGGGSSSMYNSSSSSNNPNFGLANHAKMWPTPTWQKGINNFFKKCDKPMEEESATSSDRSESCERMDSNDEVVLTTSVSCSGSSSSDGPCSSSSSTNRIYSDEEDKENIDPSSSPERLAPKVNGRRSDGSDSASPSPKMRQKKSGKQKAGPCKKKKRMVLEEDSDYDE